MKHLLFVNYLKKLVLPLELSAVHPFLPVSALATAQKAPKADVVFRRMRGSVSLDPKNRGRKTKAFLIH